MPTSKRLKQSVKHSNLTIKSIEALGITESYDIWLISVENCSKSYIAALLLLAMVLETEWHGNVIVI